MSIDMYLEEARSQAASIVKTCEQLAKGYHSLLQSSQQFVESGELSSAAYDSAKEFFASVIQPLIQGAEAGAMMTAKACQQFVDRYISDVDNVDLRSDELENHIQQLHTAISNMESINRKLQQFSLGNTPLEQANNQIIEALAITKHDLEQKLGKLLVFNELSPDIFLEVNDFYTTLSQGLKQAHVSVNQSTNTFAIPAGADLGWAETASTNYLKNKLAYLSNKLPDLDTGDVKILPEFSEITPEADMPSEL